VGREKGFAVLSIVFLVGSEEAVHPWQPSLLAVVCMQDHGNTIELGYLSDVECPSDTSSDGSSVVGVVCGLACDELAAAFGERDHDGTSILLGGLHTGVD